MVIINTSADDVSIQAVSPLLICGSGEAAGALGIAGIGSMCDLTNTPSPKE
jgi:hypothetical protein